MFLFFYVANIDIQHIRRKVNINRRLNFANSLMANLLTFNSAYNEFWKSFNDRYLT